MKNTLADCPGFEQHKAEQNRVPHTAPNSPDGVAAYGDALHQHAVDAHAEQDQQALKAHGEQGLDVVLAHLPGFPVGEGCHGDGGQTGEHIDFQHTAIDKDENDDAHNLHRKADKQGLHEQPQQGAKLHGFKRCLQRCQHIRGDVGGALDNASGSGDHALGHIEHSVYNVECVR